MPELPEVETARRSLVRCVAGKTVARAVVLRRPALRTHAPRPFARIVRGTTITAVARHGKTLHFRLDGWVLVFHHMLWGVVRFHPAAPKPEPATSLLLTFTDGSGLEFRELQLSRFHLVRAGRESALVDSGIAPLGAGTTLAVFRRALGTRRTVKDALCDQPRVAGIGNLWAHEILFAAGLRPARPVGTLTPAETRALYVRMRDVLRRAIAAGGEPGFQDARGRMGRYRLAVYGRAGQPCPRCGRRIRGGRLGGRPTFYCPACQR